MHIFCTIAGILSILGILLDAFETVVLPRRVQRSFRLTSWFYRRTWIPYRKIAGRIPSRARRESRHAPRLVGLFQIRLDYLISG